jgi:hypothetical protein
MGKSMFKEQNKCKRGKRNTKWLRSKGGNFAVVWEGENIICEGVVVKIILDR